LAACPLANGALGGISYSGQSALLGQARMTGGSATQSISPMGLPLGSGQRAQVFGVDPRRPAYPLAFKVFLNSVRGFGNSLPSPQWPDGDREDELAKCFATLPFNGSIDVGTFANGLVPLPPGVPPHCVDFREDLECGARSNVDACADNTAPFPVSSCLNGLQDGDETAIDVCPAARPTCSASGQCL